MLGLPGCADNSWAPRYSGSTTSSAASSFACSTAPSARRANSSKPATGVSAYCAAATRISGSYDLRHLLGGRGVARARAAHHAVDHHHADTRQVAEADGVEHRLARRMLRLVEEHEIGGAADLDQAAIELADARGVA